MEQAGFLVDRKALYDFGESLTSSIEQLQQSIWALAGEPFNIQSPKQLGNVLFERLMLPAGKKTKTGWSTNAAVLDKLRGHEITGPVVFDWEVIGKREARTYGIETGVLCAAANAFCKIIKDAGYDPMIYITDYAGYVKYDLSEVMDYPLWYARYDVDAPSFYYDFAMWQYSSKGLSLIHI